MVNNNMFNKINGICVLQFLNIKNILNHNRLTDNFQSESFSEFINKLKFNSSITVT